MPERENWFIPDFTCSHLPRNSFMRKSKTLKKLREGQIVHICSMGHYLPPYAQVAADVGFDCVWLDLEHRTLAIAELQSLLTGFHLHDIDCLLRPATREKASLCRFLEDGATGLMFPHVASADEARRIVNMVKFPPVGDRGLNFASFDADFKMGGVTVESYVEHTNRETFVVAQIETPDALACAGEIASVDGIDALFVGLGDLGLRLQHDKRQLEEAITTVAVQAKNSGKPWGCPVADESSTARRTEQGAQLLAIGSDFQAMHLQLVRWKKSLDAGIENAKIPPD